MAPSLCTELDAGQKSRLLEIARQSICWGLRHGRELRIDAAQCAGVLGETLASFVTLTRDGALRGCIGSLRASRPLARDVAHAAFEAAFHDPRFEPVTESELPAITLDISVLSVPQRLHFSSEQELLERLVPYRDGLVLEDDGHKATFLPKVWEQLPEPKTFLAHLKRKAGLSEDYWSDTIRAYRYRATSFSEGNLAETG